jgi:SAM-dependent methyltransferase
MENSRVTATSKTADQYRTSLTLCSIKPSFKFVAPFLSGKRVLDLGSGTGEYLEKFDQRSVGVEVSEPNLGILRSKQLKVVGADVNQALPFAGGSFEAVFCSHILEHVDAPISLLRESHRVLNQDGILIIGLPLERSLYTLLSGDDYFDRHPTHLYSFSRDGLLRLVDKSGFIHGYTFVDLPLIRRLRTWWLLNLAQSLPFRLTSLVASNYWVVAQKTQ